MAGHMNEQGGKMSQKQMMMSKKEMDKMMGTKKTAGKPAGKPSGGKKGK